MLALLGNGVYGDRVEQAFYNAASACTTADFRKHVYVQTPNRETVGVRTDTMCPEMARYYQEKHWPLCCTAALTRPIPDFIQHTWLRTTDCVVAALYAPTRLRTEVGGVAVEIDEATDYPFRDRIAFTVRPCRPVRFAFAVRLPGWCEKPALALNGKPAEIAQTNGFASVGRLWSAGDRLVLTLPMAPRLMRGTDRNGKDGARPWRSVLAGPLLFAANLRGGDENTVDPSVRVADIKACSPELAGAALICRDMPRPWRWEADAAPVVMTLKTADGTMDLVPYGATRLRISMFPDSPDLTRK